MSKSRVICNTSPVIGLLRINRLDLLWELFDEILLPEAVYRELCAGATSHIDEVTEVRRCVEQGNFTIYQVKNTAMVRNLYGKLHYGELEVIVGAKENNIHLAVIDERAARRMASELLIDTLGIMGILLEAKRRGLINELKPEVDALRKTGYRISQTLYDKVLQRAGEL